MKIINLASEVRHMTKVAKLKTISRFSVRHWRIAVDVDRVVLAGWAVVSVDSKA
jgi:hypothetical protein